ncbi:MAG: AAA family ATPase [candidate division Zixibacteria bacterium]|nr:AAA family ATPase [candidate division Zixibacteria bacterium]
MIKNLNIQNFKSIQNLELDCKKINVFIGKPNTGKSNVLESAGIFSLPYAKLEELVRFEKDMSNLFYDQDLTKRIKIFSEGLQFEIQSVKGMFIGWGQQKADDQGIFHFNFDFDYGGNGKFSSNGISPFKFYKFEVIDDFKSHEPGFLRPPKGENLLTLLQTNKILKELVKDILSEFRLRIGFRPKERQLEVVKEIEDVIISYPYPMVSDTIQRIIFHLAAIETNRHSIIIFEEPEAHAFPYYTKFLAEIIARDETNQYFISTHNPYFLLSLIEKSPKDDIGIFVTYFRDYQTKVKILSQEELSEVLDLDIDIFFNLDRFVEGE